MHTGEYLCAGFSPLVENHSKEINSSYKPKKSQGLSEAAK